MHCSINIVKKFSGDSSLQVRAEVITELGRLIAMGNIEAHESSGRASLQMCV